MEHPLVPAGSAPGESASTPTNLEWLACAITWLDADLVAVQEMLRTQQAEEAPGTLLRHLAMFTGQPWNSSFPIAVWLSPLSGFNPVMMGKGGLTPVFRLSKRR
jgi:hypothetical protein